MTVTLTRFDPAEYLDTPEAQAELISDALESGDAGYIAHAFGVVARARGMTDIADKTGIKRQQLYKALKSGGNPTISTLTKVAKALGIKLAAHAG